MTVIAAAINKTGYSIAGDSGAFEGSISMTLDEPKVFKVDPWLVGVCGSLKIMEIARVSNIGEPYALRDLIAKEIAGLNVELGGWNILCVSPDGIWEIAEDLSVASFKQPYAVIGQSDIALGSLASLSRLTSMSTKDMVQETVKTCTLHNVYCQGPIKVISVNL